MNIWDIQNAYMARLAAEAPAGVAIKPTFSSTDWTDAASPLVGAHVVFDGASPAAQAGYSAAVRLKFSVHVFLDTGRGDTAEKAAAATSAEQTVLAAIRAAVGWEPYPGRETVLTEPQPTGYDGRLARISIAFAVPAMAAGIA